MSVECERLLMLLRPKDMTALRQSFIKHSNGVSVAQFVLYLSRVLPKKSSPGLVIQDMLKDVQELFAQIDVDGSGRIDWSEFSGFCIEAGMAASSFGKTKRLPNTYFEQRVSYSDITLHDGGIRKLRFSEELDKLFVLDQGEPKMWVYNVKPPPDLTRNQGRLPRSMAEEEKDVTRLKTTTHVGGEIYLLHTLISKPPSKDHLTEDEPGIIDVCVLPEIDFIALATSGLSLAFWNVHCYKELPPRMAPRFVKSVYTRTPQTVLAWHGPSRTLFSSGGSDLVVTRWKIQVLPSFACASICRYHGHVALVSDMICLPELELLVTASMDGQIFLWDTVTNKWDDARPPYPPGRTPYVSGKPGKCHKVKSRIAGHNDTGIRGISYAGEGTLLSIAFDSQIIGWNIDGVTNRPLFKLIGTRVPLLGIDCVRGSGTCVTVDINGNCRRWDIKTDDSGGVQDKDRCLQIWGLRPTGPNADVEIGGANVAHNPTSMVMTKPAGSLVMAGKSLNFFDQHVKQTADAPVSCLAYNSVAMTIIASVKNTIRVWDAKTGAFEREHVDMMSYDITALCLDGRERKFFLGDARGNVAAFNYLNGMRMQDMVFKPFKRQISNICYTSLEDRTMVSASWDGAIRVFLDEPPLEGESVLSENRTTLRAIEHAHLSDVTALTVSRSLSKIASGESTGKIKVWDVEFCSMDGLCLGHSTEVTALLFLDPLPLLVSSDADGSLCLWSLWPHHPRFVCLKRWQLPAIAGVADSVVGQTVTCMVRFPAEVKRERSAPKPEEVETDGPDEGPPPSSVTFADAPTAAPTDPCVPTIEDNGPAEEDQAAAERINATTATPATGGQPVTRNPLHCIAAADDNGYVTCWDFGSTIEEHGLVEPRKGLRPTEKNSFNPRRRCEKETDEQTEMENKIKDVFAYFDDDDSGEIDRLELCAALGAMGYPMPQAESDKILASIDFDGSGTVDSEEFQHLVMVTLVERSKAEEANMMKTGHRTQSSVDKDVSQAQAFPPFLRWEAHKSAISNLVLIPDPPSFLTAGNDISVRLWNTEGTKLGVLTRGTLKDEIVQKMKMKELWCFDYDSHAIEARDQARAENVLATVENLKRAEQRAVEAKREADEHAAHLNALKEAASPSLRSASLDGDSSSFVGFGLPTSPTKRSRAKERLVGQLNGEVTWKLNAVEEGYIRRLQTERKDVERNKLDIRADIKTNYRDPDQRQLVLMMSDDHIAPRIATYLESTHELRTKGTRLTEQYAPLEDGNLTHQLDFSEMQERLEQRRRVRQELSLPEISAIKPISLPPQDVNNWGFNSNNRQRQYYPEFYTVRDATELTEKRKEDSKKFDPRSVTGMSPFLKDALEQDKARRRALAMANKLPPVHNNSSEEVTRGVDEETSLRPEETRQLSAEASNPHAPNASPVIAGGAPVAKKRRSPAPVVFQSTAAPRNSLRRTILETQALTIVTTPSLTSLPHNGSSLASDSEISSAQAPPRVAHEAVLATQPRKRKKRKHKRKKGKVQNLQTMRRSVSQFLRRNRHTFSAPDIAGLENKVREERLIDGASTAEVIARRLKTDVDVLYDKDTYQATFGTLDKKSSREVNRKASLKSIAKLKFELFGERDANVMSSEESDVSEFEEAVVAEKPKLEFTTEEIERLRAKKNFGIYQIDMVKTFRQVIREVDEDESGEIDQVEFLMAIQKLHEKDIKIPTLEDSQTNNKTGESFSALVEKAEENSSTLQRMVESMFASIDSDGSGSITVDELVGVLFPRAPPHDMHDIHMYLMMPSTPRFEETEDVEDEEPPLRPEQLEELKLLFDLYDEDGSGTLEIEELRNACQGSFLFDGVSGDNDLSSEAANITTTDFQRFMDAGDVDGDGIIDFEEWVEMMKHIYQ